MKIKQIITWRILVTNKTVTPEYANIPPSNYSEFSLIEFDKFGNKIKIEICNQEGKLESQRINEFDIEGVLTQSNYLIGGKLNSYTAYTHTNDGKISHRYNSDEELMGITQIREDEKGRTIEVIELDSFYKIKSIVKFKYDEESPNFEKVFFNSTGEIVNSSNHYFDDRGNEIEINHSYKYDQNKNRIETLFLDQKGRIQTKYKYFYDDNGNCTRKVEFLLNKPHCIELSEIIYF